MRVGKLSKDAFKPTPDSPKEERVEAKVGNEEKQWEKDCCSGAGKNQHKGPLCTS